MLMVICSYFFLLQIKSEQNLPKNVCHACVYKLEMWNEFKERFIRSNRLLLTRLEVADTAKNSVRSFIFYKNRE